MLCKVHLPLVLLLLCFASPMWAALRKKIPRLEYDSRDTIFLKSGEPWQPSQSTLVVALMVNEPLLIRLKLRDEESVAEPTYLLSYKCTSSDASFQKIQLPNTGALGGSLCNTKHPFTVRQVAHRQFNLTLLSNNIMPFEHALRHCMEFRVLIGFKEGVIESNSLFVYNLDGLASFNRAPTNVMNTTFTRHLLTDEALTFLNTLRVPSNNGSLGFLPFLNRQFVEVLGSAPVLIRSLISVSILFVQHKGCSDEPSNYIYAIFTSGDPHEILLRSNTANRDLMIHLQNGALLYSIDKLASLQSTLTPLLSKSLRVCLRVSLNAPIWKYQLSLTISNALNGPFLEVPPVSMNMSECKLPDGIMYTWLVLIEGTQDVIIMSPIVCLQWKTSVMAVYFKDKECTNRIAETKEVWQSCVDGYQISRFGHIIRLSGKVGRKHSGVYMFKAGDISYTYVVSVATMPVFQTSTAIGSLPHITFANLDSVISFSCTVFHDGLRYVTLVPVFRVLDLFAVPRWQDLGADEFALEILKMSPRSIMLQESHLEYETTLLVVMPHITALWKTWKLLYTCQADIKDEDASAFGVANYRVGTTTDVVYFGDRIISARINQANAVTVILLFFAATALWLLPTLTAWDPLTTQ